MYGRLSLSLLIAAVPTFALADPREDAQAAFNQFFVAFTDADAEKITALFAPDATFYGTTVKAPVDRDGVRAYFDNAFGGRAPGVIEGSIVGEPTITMVTDDVAAVSGVWQNTGMRDGQMTTRVYRVTATLADRGDGWEIVNFHNSAMPE